MTSSDAVRQPTPLVGKRFDGQIVSPQWAAGLTAMPAFHELVAYFRKWPPHSFMSDESRATLYALIAALKPAAVAEIGTLFAGTTQVMARALWENGGGVLHTTDPYGAERCPRIIAAWPGELQAITQFHPLNSMDFFLKLEQQKVSLDLVLVDGNHDYEFALFDLQMAARLLRPGGIIVMDNAEQTGPFKAARSFVRDNPAWRELGTTLTSYDPTLPFDARRASVPGTTFVILQAPPHLSIGTGPQSWGQVRTELSSIDGFMLDIPAQKTRGTLHYQAIFRGFADGNRAGVELRSIGSILLELERPGAHEHRLPTPLKSDLRERYDDAFFTFEIDLSWQPDPQAPPLALAAVPIPTWSA